MPPLNRANIVQPLRLPEPGRTAVATIGRPGFSLIPAGTTPGPAMTPPRPGARATSQPAGSRWSGSTWLLLRGGDGIAPGLRAGQLGGAQGGIRLAYTLDEACRLSLVTRVTMPLRGPGHEASVGLEWQPAPVPLKLVVERRIALDRSHGGTAVGIIGGTGPAPLMFGFDLVTYGQAGTVSRARLEPFADGAAILTRTIAASHAVHVDLGVGIWGGAQREATRLDIGPSLGTTFPRANGSLRLSLDWRERVAGGARPGSSAALTLGSDF